MSSIQADIEARLAQVEPEVEVLLAEVDGHTVRLFIDHPQGVSHDLCARVTNHLAALRATHALEVSSPGRERPLSKPDHFRRFLGRRARIRTRQPIEAGHRSVTGELMAAGEEAVTLNAPGGVVSIPYAEIRRSNLVGE